MVIVAAIDRCRHPALVFDLARIEANLRSIADAARACQMTALFAAKSFPHRSVRELAAKVIDGFDAASDAEVAELPPAKVVSLSDPSHRGRAAGAKAERVIISCETADQVRAAPAHADIAIRLSSSIVGRDPAVGAVQEGSGHRRSRFGLDVDPERRRAEIQAMWAAAAGRTVGMHIHHGPVTATNAERFAATARVALDAARDAGREPAFINVGGAWHGIIDIPGACRELRDAIPDTIELVIEPGRAATHEAGFACGHVVAARDLDDRALRVTDISRICHLRWSHLELVCPAPHPGTGAPMLLVGPTCFEEDVLGEWSVDLSRFDVGARVVMRNVSGYAVAWNTGFAGIPPADVVVV